MGEILPNRRARRKRGGSTVRSPLSPSEAVTAHFRAFYAVDKNKETLV